ncbi:unnamed protein product [Prunus armeniaca]|uniref:Uncharacterized protein n=1 Tax=Prunus armeniaca TaxID=36596 RepID=A0A6J5WRF6_PRUAR|nr:unnamed protein product [Prunus armeniaca]CAB4300898.1 unnamed protein product [Prunus armeniaca]
MGRRENEMEAGGGASGLGLVGLGRRVGKGGGGRKKTSGREKKKNKGDKG